MSFSIFFQDQSQLMLDYIFIFLTSHQFFQLTNFQQLQFIQLVQFVIKPQFYQLQLKTNQLWLKYSDQSYNILIKLQDHIYFLRTHFIHQWIVIQPRIFVSINHLVLLSEDRFITILTIQQDIIIIQTIYAKDQLTQIQDYRSCIVLIFTLKWTIKNQQNGYAPHFLNCTSKGYFRLYDKIQQSIPLEHETFQLCKSLNTRAPLTVRINPSKTTRGDFIKKISNFLNIQLKKTEVSPFGIIVPSNRNVDLYDTQQFKQGHFQIQDQASQIAALQVKCRPGDIILDYCSGSGGKSLAISHLLEGKGQVFLHDPRPKTLENAKKRFQRNGIQNVQFHSDQTNLQKIILGKADWVILDVPCSGTGTIRRNPDIKLRFNEESLKNYVLQQQEIFAKSLKYLKKNGHIVYITCSILREQNENQVKKFIKQFNLEVVNNQIVRTKTQKGGMDSMFAAVLKRKKMI